MKIVKILLVLGLSFALFSCDRELPYDLDGVTKGVVIDVKKKFGTDELVESNSTAGNFTLNVSVPIEQGNYSNLKKVQLMCHFIPASGATQYILIKDDITEFPAEVVLNLAQICTDLGITNPALGDRFSFVPDVYLKNGVVIPGWNKHSGGYPNSKFSSWRTLEERANGTKTRLYSHMASYLTAAALVMSKFQGPSITINEAGPWGPLAYTVAVDPLTAGDMPDQETMDKFDVTADILEGLLITGMPKMFLSQGYPETFKVWVNTRNHELIIPKQVIATDFDLFGDGDVGEVDIRNATGSVNTIDTSISFKGNLVFQGAYSWSISFKLDFTPVPVPVP